ncbi:MAG: FHA domain-containing protein [Deltaproteobacteria bacterium]|nr:FHA domain-containing protein [Deltaproteobacteria bacterium]
MNPKMYILAEKGKNKEFELEDEKVYSIGRSPMNAIHIRDSHMSRYHLRVRCKEGRYYVKDLHTKNGTFVGGEDIERGVEVEVEDGVPVVIGMTVLGFGEQFASSCVPFLHSIGISGQADEDGDIEKPFRSMTIRKNLGCVYNVNKALLESKDIDEIINILLDNIFNLLKRIDRCAVILYDDRKEDISRVAYRSKKADDSPEKAYNKDMVLRTIMFNRSYMVRDTGDSNYGDDELTKSLHIMKIGSAACVPMSTYFHTLGAIYVDTIEKSHGFRKNDIAILKDIGNRAALAMDEKVLFH